MSQTQGLVQEPQFLRSQVVAQQSAVFKSLELSVAQTHCAFYHLSLSRQYPYSFFRF